MRVRFRQFCMQLTSSFWFLPTLMTIVALGLAVGMLRLDFIFSFKEWVKENPVLFTTGEGARTLLATIAGSTISVAGVVFSITIVVLNMAAVQLGPRLLRNFMYHRGTQIVLGAFVATFTYSLVVLRFVQDSSSFVPHIAANVGLLLGLASFFLLIYFIHHVSIFIQASRVIDDVAVSMEHAVRASFPERTDRHRAPDDEQSDAEPERIATEGAAVHATRSGYLQIVELDALVELAEKHDACIRLAYRPGHFVIEGAALAQVAPAGAHEETAEATRACMGFGPQRSQAQDPEFAVNQLVEVAMRALSPGINDPFTALNCIDRLAAALALLASRQLPSRFLRDEDGTVRVITNPLTYAGIVEAAFNPLRQAADGHVAVVLRLLEVIGELGRRDLPDAFRDALARQLDAIETRHDNRFTNAVDKTNYQDRITGARATIATTPI